MLGWQRRWGDATRPSYRSSGGLGPGAVRLRWNAPPNKSPRAGGANAVQRRISAAMTELGFIAIVNEGKAITAARSCAE